MVHSTRSMKSVWHSYGEKGNATSTPRSRVVVIAVVVVVVVVISMSTGGASRCGNSLMSSMRRADGRGLYTATYSAPSSSCYILTTRTPHRHAIAMTRRAQKFPAKDAQERENEKVNLFFYIVLHIHIHTHTQHTNDGCRSQLYDSSLFHTPSACEPKRKPSFAGLWSSSAKRSASPNVPLESDTQWHNAETDSGKEKSCTIDAHLQCVSQGKLRCTPSARGSCGL